jgi:hypothetical protein
MTPRLRLHKTMAQHSPHPQRDACSSRRAGSFTGALARWRDAQVNGGNKQGTSNSGTQPPTTIISTTWIHARSGQPLVLTLNGTMRILTYKQEAGGSSPSPPIQKPPQSGRFEPLSRCARRRWEQAARHAPAARGSQAAAARRLERAVKPEPRFQKVRATRARLLSRSAVGAFPYRAFAGAGTDSASPTAASGRRSATRPSATHTSRPRNGPVAHRPSRTCPARA